MTSNNIKCEYLQLIKSFLRDEISANTFSLKYLDKMKNDNRSLGDDLYELLEEMFGQANSYTDNPKIYRSNPTFYLTANELKDKAFALSKKLRDLHD